MTTVSDFLIGSRRVGPDQPTYFIADIAANHDGDLGRAKLLMTLAKEAGADCAKFQHFRAPHIVSDYGFKALGSQQSHQATWKKSKKPTLIRMVTNSGNMNPNFNKVDVVPDEDLNAQLKFHVRLFLELC